MKKFSMLVLGLMLIAPVRVCAVDFNVGGGMMNPIGYESGLMRNHDMQMLNQRRFEFEKSREYQAEQRAKKQEEEIKTKFRHYEAQKNTSTMPKSNMEFMQNPNGSITIREMQ